MYLRNLVVRLKPGSETVDTFPQGVRIRQHTCKQPGSLTRRCVLPLFRRRAYFLVDEAAPLARCCRSKK